MPLSCTTLNCKSGWARQRCRRAGLVVLNAISRKKQVMGLIRRAVSPNQGARALFVEQRLPVCRHRPFRSWCGLIQRMAVRGAKLRPLERFFRAIVVKPVLARLEARDDRVAGGSVVFRCMLIWRTITAADVTTLGASAKMEPPRTGRRAFDAAGSAWLCRLVDTVPLGFHTLLSDFRLLRLLRIAAVFDSELTCRYRAAAYVVARPALSWPASAQHSGFVFVS
jgi:hypothetical protein